MSEAAQIWRALADPTRRHVLELLRAGPRTTGDLCAQFDQTRFGVIRHLEVLQRAGLVVVEKRGRERWNHLNAAAVREELEHWLTPFAAELATATLALKTAAEARPQALARGGSMETQTETQARATSTVHRGDIDVATEVRVGAPREVVFDALLDVGTWWPHRFRPGSGCTLERHVGGRWYEDWGNGEGALYGTLTRVERPSTFVVTGPMGMAGPVASVWSIELSDAEVDADGAAAATIVRGTHKAFGDISAETREGYARGWEEVYAALRQHLAT